MPTPTVSLTQEQWEKIQKDASGIHMLTQKEVEKLATLLNKKVNIPLMSETTEQTILVKIVRRVDSYLYNALPNELYEQIRDASDGISNEEADQMRAVLATRLNKEVNIKYLPEFVEQQIFELLFGVLISAMRKTFHLDQAIAEADSTIADAKK